MKKLCSLLLVLAMVLGLMAGCGTGTDTAKTDSAAAPAVSAADVTETPDEAPTAPAPVGSELESGSAVEGPVEKGEFTANAAELPWRTVRYSPISVSCPAICPCLM